MKLYVSGFATAIFGFIQFHINVNILPQVYPVVIVYIVKTTASCIVINILMVHIVCVLQVTM